jgi:hypothetical protein
MTRSILLYTIISAIIMLVFNLVAMQILGVTLAA